MTEVSLHPSERSALLQQLFAVWRALEPGRFHCFCGSDADLVRAVRDARARQHGQLRRAASSVAELGDRAAGGREVEREGVGRDHRRDVRELEA